jgi:dipeptidase E
MTGNARLGGLLWDGLALLHEAFVPHFQSPGHPETAAIELVVARYRAEGIAHRTLHDGQALLVNGSETMIV